MQAEPVEQRLLACLLRCVGADWSVWREARAYKHAGGTLHEQIQQRISEQETAALEELGGCLEWTLSCSATRAKLVALPKALLISLLRAARALSEDTALRAIAEWVAAAASGADQLCELVRELLRLRLLRVQFLSPCFLGQVLPVLFEQAIRGLSISPPQPQLQPPAPPGDAAQAQQAAQQAGQAQQQAGQAYTWDRLMFAAASSLGRGAGGGWQRGELEAVFPEGPREQPLGGAAAFQLRIDLGCTVDALAGSITRHDELAEAVPTTFAGSVQLGAYEFAAQLVVSASGELRLQLRARPALPAGPGLPSCRDVEVPFSCQLQVVAVEAEAVGQQGEAQEPLLAPPLEIAAPRRVKLPAAGAAGQLPLRAADGFWTVLRPVQLDSGHAPSSKSRKSAGMLIAMHKHWLVEGAAPWRESAPDIMARTRQGSRLCVRLTELQGLGAA
jgi:hypothetical protein